MVHRPDPTKQMEQQLLMKQYQMQKANDAAEAAFQQERAANAAKSLAAINAQKAANSQQRIDAASKPVGIGTLLTSPQGLLGNPMLSNTRLGA